QRSLRLQLTLDSVCSPLLAGSAVEYRFWCADSLDLSLSSTMPRKTIIEKRDIVREAYSCKNNVKATARKYTVQPQHIRRWLRQLERMNIIVFDDDRAPIYRPSRTSKLMENPKPLQPITPKEQPTLIHPGPSQNHPIAPSELPPSPDFMIPMPQIPSQPSSGWYWCDPDSPLSSTSSSMGVSPPISLAGGNSALAQFAPAVSSSKEPLLEDLFSSAAPLFDPSVHLIPPVPVWSTASFVPPLLQLAAQPAGPSICRCRSPAPGPFHPPTYHAKYELVLDPVHPQASPLPRSAGIYDANYPNPIYYFS
ncbi:uncharacterized protein BJ171DRAFT_629947, partial [Polychytrium aggregatum]|uniref:uncharacterized protein n=1 Tax=Polychytrium aggregatum TaxID=110093 RepID=UPI0022FEAC41